MPFEDLQKEQTKSPESKESREGKLEAVLEGLKNKQAEIIRSVREKLPPDSANLFDSTILSIYGPLVRLKEQNWAKQEDVDEVAAMPTQELRKSGLADSLARKGDFLKEHEDALLIGGYGSYEEMSKSLADIKKKRGLAVKMSEVRPTKEDWEEATKINELVAQREKDTLAGIRSKFTWINSKFPFRERFPQDFPNREAVATLMQNAKELNSVGFAGNYFGKLLDLMDLHEAGVVNLDKMDGSELVNLYESAKAKTPASRLEVLEEMEQLRQAYQFGLIPNRQEYLALVKQSSEKNGNKTVWDTYQEQQAATSPK